MRDTIGFRQQLSTTSFEAFELEIVVNCLVHTWTENESLTTNLVSWSVSFWLVLLTEHKVLLCYTPNVVYCCVVAGQFYLSWGFSLVDCRCFQVSNPSREIHATAFMHHTALIEILNQNPIFLWNFHDFVYLLLIFRSWQFSKVK